MSHCNMTQMPPYRMTQSARSRSIVISDLVDNDWVRGTSFYCDVSGDVTVFSFAVTNVAAAWDNWLCSAFCEIEADLDLALSDLQNRASHEAKKPV